MSLFHDLLLLGGADSPNKSNLFLPFTTSYTFNDCYGHVMTKSSSPAPVIVPTEGRWGQGCAHFLAEAGLYLSSPDFILSGDFTVECWLKFTSNISYQYYRVFETRSYFSGADIEHGLTLAAFQGSSPIKLMAQIGYLSSNTVQLINNSPLVVNAWNYVKVGRQGNTLYLQVNDNQVSIYSETMESILYGDLSINRVVGHGGYSTESFMNDFRITRGIWLAGTAIPTAPFPRPIA